MTEQSFLNNYRDELQAGVSDTDTTLTLGDVTRVNAAVFRQPIPVPYPLLLTLVPAGTTLPAFSDVEVVRVTNVDTGNNTVTVERGQDGSTAKSWSSGAVVGARLTADSLESKLPIPSLDERIAANPSFSPDAFWITTDPQSGAGPAFQPYPSIESKDAFVVGGSNSALGDYATAFGQNQSAESTAGFAAGNGNTVSGAYAASFGNSNTVEAKNGFAAGAYNYIYADANNSFVAGQSNKDYGSGSVSASVLAGYSNINRGKRSLMVGSSNENEANGAGFFAEQSRNLADQCLIVGRNHYNSSAGTGMLIGSNAFGAEFGSFVQGDSYYSLPNHTNAESVRLTRALNTDGDANQSAYYGLRLLGSDAVLKGQAQVVGQTTSYEAAWNVDFIAYWHGSSLNVKKTISQQFYTGNANSWGVDVVTNVPSANGYDVKIQVQGVAGEQISWGYVVDAMKLHSPDYFT